MKTKRERIAFTCTGCGANKVAMLFPYHCKCGQTTIEQATGETEPERRPRPFSRRDRPRAARAFPRRPDDEILEIKNEHCVNCKHWRAEYCIHPGLMKCKKRSKIDWLAFIRNADRSCPDRRWGNDETNYHDFTICITTYRRPDELRKLLASIEQHYPDAEVLVQYTGGNLSLARNLLMEHCRTDVAIIMEEDMLITSETDLRAMIDVLKEDSMMIACCGALRNKHGNIAAFCYDLRSCGSELESEYPPAGQPRITENGTPYRRCDIGYNFMAVRRTLCRRIPWDEQLELLEHTAWFWSVKQSNSFKVAFTGASICDHYGSRPSEGYTVRRGRSSRFSNVLYDKYGFGQVNYAPTRSQQRDAPNIIMLGTGASNTSITVKQLKLLGWNTCDADAEYSESVRFRNLNRELIKGVVKQEALNDFIRGLPQPWVLKDPRFSFTWRQWLKAMQYHSPMLLYVAKPIDACVRTLEKRGVAKDSSFHAQTERKRNCEFAYIAWPWAKIKLEASGIAEACKIFDYNRFVESMKGRDYEVAGCRGNGSEKAADDSAMR